MFHSNYSHLAVIFSFYHPHTFQKHLYCLQILLTKLMHDLWRTLKIIKNLIHVFLQLCKFMRFLQIFLLLLWKWLFWWLLTLKSWLPCATCALCIYLCLLNKGLARTCIHFYTLFKQYLCTHEVLNKTYKYHLCLFWLN